MSWVAVAVAGSAVVGSVVSKSSADKATKSAEKTAAAGQAQVDATQARVAEAVEKLEALTPPNLLQYIQPFTKQVLQGTLTPEEATYQIQQATEQAGIKVPQELLNAQTKALTQVQQIADSGGLTAVDRAALGDIQAQQANRSAAEQGAILQEAQQRGIAGGGAEMAARLLSQQQAANRGAASGLQVAANAQAARTDAIKQAATMAGQMRDQDVSQQQKAADAQDLINRFNVSLRNQTDASNVAARNAAQASNLAAAQNVSNFNAQQSQLENAARLAAAQQQFQNTFNQATNAANITGGQAGQALTANAQAQNLANTQSQNANAANAAAIQQAGTAATKLVDAYGRYNSQPTTATTDRSSFRADDPYKNPNYFGGDVGE